MSTNVTMIRESVATAKPLIDQVVARFYENLASDFPVSTLEALGVEILWAAPLPPS